MNLRQLRCFCEVVDSGTLSRAAERLFIAPTAISMQISHLEEGLGGSLFDRSVKPMKLTTLGQFFLPRARELLSQGERLEQDTRDMAEGRRGWLGIGFVRSLLYSVLPSAVRSFRLKYPEVKLDLIELLSEHQPAQLRSGRIHIGLSRHTRPIDPPLDLRHTVLFEDAMLAAVPASHQLARRSTAPLTAFSGVPLISYPKDPHSTFPQFVLSVLEAAGARPQVGHEAIEIHTALGLVAAGLGFAIVSASVADRGLGDVKFLTVPEIKARTTVLAVTRADEQGMLVASMLETLTSLRGVRLAPSGRRSR